MGLPFLHHHTGYQLSRQPTRHKGYVPPVTNNLVGFWDPADVSTIRIKEEYLTLPFNLGVELDVVSVAWSLNTVTIETSVNHGYTTGDQVNIRGLSVAKLNGDHSIAVTLPNFFTYPVTGANPVVPTSNSKVTTGPIIENNYLTVMELKNKAGTTSSLKDSLSLRQPFVSRRPLYNHEDPSWNSKPSIEFTGIDEFLYTATLTAPLAQPNYYFLVIEIPAFTGVPGANSSEEAYIMGAVDFNNRNVLAYPAGTSTNLGISASLNVWKSGLRLPVSETLSRRIYLVQFDSDNALHIDGRVALSYGTAGGNLGTVGFTIGGAPGLGFKKMKLLMMLFYHGRSLSIQERNSIGSSLATYFGISWHNITN